MPLSNQRAEEDQVLSNVEEVVADQQEQPEVDTQQEPESLPSNTSGPLSKLPGALVEIEGSSQRRSSRK